MAGLTSRYPYAKPPARSATSLGSTQTGPSPMDVLRSGGTYNYSRNPLHVDPSGRTLDPPDTYTTGPTAGPASEFAQRAQSQRQQALTGLGQSLQGLTTSGTTPGNYAGGIPPVQLTRSVSGGGGMPAQVGAYSGGAMSSPASERLQSVDTSAANAAAFARAKDQVGQTARGALTGLAGAMAGRGTVGSGVEGRGMSNIINAGQGQLGDVSREQAITGADIAQKNAALNYQGGITQRGQDIASAQARNDQMLRAREQDISQRGQDINSLTSQRGQDIGLDEAQFQGGIAQRGQDISAQQAAAQRALQALLAQYQGNLKVAGY